MTLPGCRTVRCSKVDGTSSLRDGHGDERGVEGSPWTEPRGASLVSRDHRTMSTRVGHSCGVDPSRVLDDALPTRLRFGHTSLYRAPVAGEP